MSSSKIVKKPVKATDLLYYIIWERISLFLDEVSLMRLGGCCTILREIVNAEDLWKVRFDLEFGKISTNQDGEEHDDNDVDDESDDKSKNKKKTASNAPKLDVFTKDPRPAVPFSLPFFTKFFGTASSHIKTIPLVTFANNKYFLQALATTADDVAFKSSSQAARVNSVEKDSYAPYYTSKKYSAEWFVRLVLEATQTPASSISGVVESVLKHFGVTKPNLLKASESVRTEQERKYYNEVSMHIASCRKYVASLKNKGARTVLNKNKFYAQQSLLRFKILNALLMSNVEANGTLANYRGCAPYVAGAFRWTMPWIAGYAAAYFGASFLRLSSSSASDSKLQSIVNLFFDIHKNFPGNQGPSHSSSASDAWYFNRASPLYYVIPVLGYSIYVNNRMNRSGAGDFSTRTWFVGDYRASVIFYRVFFKTMSDIAIHLLSYATIIARSRLISFFVVAPAIVITYPSSSHAEQLELICRYGTYLQFYNTWKGIYHGLFRRSAQNPFSLLRLLEPLPALFIRSYLLNATVFDYLNKNNSALPEYGGWSYSPAKLLTLYVASLVGVTQVLEFVAEARRYRDELFR